MYGLAVIEVMTLSGHLSNIDEMVSFEIFVKSMTPSLLELKVTPGFCFAFIIPDDPTATSTYYA